MRASTASNLDSPARKMVRKRYLLTHTESMAATARFLTVRLAGNSPVLARTYVYKYAIYVIKKIVRSTGIR